MSKCNFAIDFTGSPDLLIEKAQAAISQAGGTFNGDSSAGDFSISTPVGSVSGRYSVVGQSFNILIEDKPFFVSCNKIETTLRGYIKGQ